MRRIGVELRNLSLLTVGSAYPRLTLADVNTVRIGGEVVIPGSSLKGALRTAAHRAAGRLGLTSCGQVEPGMISKAHEAMGRVCDVCELFGMPGAAGSSSSKLFVSNLRPKLDISTITVTRVSLDPARGKAREGGLFTVEAIPPCTLFEGEITLLSDDGKHLKLLLAALDELASGSFGRGAIVEVRVSDVPLQEFKHLESWRWDVCP